jgi:hypothetical protein
VRVEGATDTLVPKTQISTTSRSVVKDGNPAHACTGSSAAGALQRATDGDWSGPYFDTLGYSVETIKGEKHEFTSGAYWSFWLNYKPSEAGVCGVELKTGDEVLLFPDCLGSGCANPVPLRLRAPDTSAPGRSIAVRVTEHLATGASRPAAGATVTAGASTYTTGPDGRARVPAEGREVRLRATGPDRVRSATETVCVTTGDDGRCGAVTVRTPRHDREYLRGPRRLRGRVSADPSGLRRVELRLTRTAGGDCFSYRSGSERFRRGCGERAWFSAGADRRWTYTLARRLAPGRYVLKAVAVDGDGNRSAIRPGSSKVVFRVR